MKHVLMVSLLLIVGALGAYGQSETKEAKSPREVVEEFWKLETQGRRLTPEGWRKAAIFFVHPGSPPQKKTLAVISGRNKYSVDERWIKGDRAEIWNGCIDLGRIDDALRYTPPDPRYDKAVVSYHLVLTDKHWEFGPDAVTEKEVSGPLAWRIENPEPIFWLTVETAIPAGQTSSGRLNHLAAARALLSALYPELSGKDLTLSYSGSFSFDGSPDPQPNMLDITVSPFPANHHPIIAGVIRQDPSQTAAPARTELGAFVWFGRGGYVYRFAAKSDKILNTSKNEALRKLIDSHPEWPDTRITEELRAAGAKFAPDEKEQLLKTLPLARLEPILGKLRVESARFDAKVEAASANSMAMLDWDIAVVGVMPDGEQVSYSLSVEPFEGKIVQITQLPQDK